MRKTIVALLTGLAIAAGPAPLAADTLRLDEHDVIQRVRSHNLGLQAERAVLEARERSANSAANVILPSVRASSGLVRSNEETVPMPAGDPYSLSVASTLELQLQLSAAALEGIRSARLAYSAGQASYRDTRAQLEVSLRSAFHGLIVLREAIEVARNGQDSATEQLSQVSQAFRAGTASARAQRSAESAVMESETAVRKLLSEYQSAQEQLAVALDYPGGTRIEPVGQLLHPASDPGTEPGSAGIGARTDLQLIDAQHDLQQSVVRARTLQQRTPTLSLSQSWNSTLLDPFNPDNPPDRAELDRGAFAVSLSMPLDSLLPFSAGAVSIRNERDILRSLDLQRQQARQSAAAEVSALQRALESSAQTIAALAGRAELAEQIYELTAEAHDAGLAPYLELRDAEREWQRARFDLLNERYSYTVTRIRLEYATGDML